MSQFAEYQEEDFREHDRFVAALARQLVRDPGHAAETAQDAWTIALAKDRPREIPLRAWLAGIVRNLARSRRRDSARRERIDATLAIQQGRTASYATSPDELLARTELEQRVMRAVLGLEEPIRSVILLRFREGRTSTEIGRALGISAGTARWRIHHGISAIREQLDQEHGGDREAWLPGVAAIGTNKVPESVSVLGKVLAMNMKITAALIAVIALTVWVVIGGPETETTRGSAENPFAEPLDPLPATVKAPTGPASPIRSEAESLSSEDAESFTTLAVQGRCLAPDGSPLAGIDFKYGSAEEVARRWDWDSAEIQGGKTRNDGTFAVEIPIHSLPSGQSPRPSLIKADVPEQALRFSGRGRIPKIISTFMATKDGIDIGDVVMERGAEIRGHVVDEYGEPVSNAKVQLVDPGRLALIWRVRTWFDSIGDAVRTDSRGAFHLSGLPSGWARVVASAEEHFNGASDTLNPQSESPLDGITIVLPAIADRVVEGIAVEFDGTPIPRGRVYYEYSVGESGLGTSLFTGEDGRFSIPSFHNVPFSLRLVHDGATVPMTDVMPGKRDIELRLPPMHKSVFTVIDGSTDLPIPSFSGSVQAEGFRQSLYARDQLDGQASYSVIDAPFTIHVSSHGYLEGKAGPFSPNPLPAHLVITLQPAPSSPAPTTHGIVVHNGQPVEGAEIYFTEHTNVMESWGFPIRSYSWGTPGSTTKAGGLFAVGEPRFSRGQPFYIHAEARGLAPAEIGPFSAADVLTDESLTLELTIGGAIEGTVQVPNGRSPAGLLVAASKGDGFPIATRTNRDGHYRLTSVAPGAWQVELRSTDFVDPIGRLRFDAMDDSTAIPSNCVVSVGKITRLDLSTESVDRCTLSGTTPRPGSPTSLSVKLSVCPDPSLWDVTPGRPESCRPYDLRGDRVQSTLVSPDGTYSLSGIRPGPHIIVLTDESLGRPDSSRVEALVHLAPGETVFDFPVEYGSIEGSYTGPLLHPTRGYERNSVEWKVPISSQVLASGRGRAAPDGTFTLKSVPIGETFVRRTPAWTRVSGVPGGTGPIEIE